MNRPLSIGIVCFPSMGGSGVVATEIAVGLAARGHDIHLIATERPARAEASSRLRFHRVRMSDYPLFDHAPYAVAVASKLIDVAREHPLDVLHVHYALPHAASGFLARQLLGPKAPRLVTTLHGTDVTRVGADPNYRSITAATVAASDGVTVPSDFLRREAFARLGLAPTVAIEVIPNFVDTERFAPGPVRDPSKLHALFDDAQPGGPVLFHVSNFRPVKRTWDLIEILARVRRSVPARLVVVGDGPDRQATEARARALGLEGSVRFLGKRDDFVALLREADAFVLPSETESFGVAALEALSAGVPVFAYRVGGLPELVAEGAGRLVEPFDVDALAHAVLEAITTPGAMEAMRHSARQRAVTHFRRDPALDRYEAFFRRVIAGGQERA